MPEVREGDAAYDADDAAPTISGASQPYVTTMGPLALEPTGTAHTAQARDRRIGSGPRSSEVPG